jgi:hypothetical protein
MKLMSQHADIYIYMYIYVYIYTHTHAALLYLLYQYKCTNTDAVVELMSAASALPVQLYEGGDLGYSDCGESGELSYLAPYFHKVYEALSYYCMMP